MKSNVMPSIVRLEANELKQLVTEVKETVAKDFVCTGDTKSAEGRFGIVDLWHIRKRVRIARLASRWSL